MSIRLSGLSSATDNLSSLAAAEQALSESPTAFASVNSLARHSHRSAHSDSMRISALEELGIDPTGIDYRDILDIEEEQAAEEEARSATKLAIIQSPPRQHSRTTSFSNRDSNLHTDSCAILRYRARKIVQAKCFDWAMSAVIVANSATIGLEQSYRLARWDTTFFGYAEHGFLVTYLLELGLRLFATRGQCLASGWVRFDATLVTIGIVSNWVVEPFIGDSQHLTALMVLRTARLLRLARTLRLIARFREAWMLVQGLLASVRTLLHTMALCVVLLYVFGCMSIELIPLAYQGEEATLDLDVQEIIHANFRSLPAAMLTLVQFITFDNVVYIYRPLIEANVALAFFFVSVLAVVGIVFMNLVTAIIVNGGLEQAMQDKHMIDAVKREKRRRLLKDLRQAFLRADMGSTGEVSREELLSLSDDDKATLDSILGVSDLLPIFDSLDVYGRENVDIDELINGIESVVLSGATVEFKRMERIMEATFQQVQESQKAVEELRRNIGAPVPTDSEKSAPMRNNSKSPKGRSGKVRKVREAEPEWSPEEEEQQPGGAAGAVGAVPRWTDELVHKVQETMACEIKEMKKAMGEACTGFLEEARDSLRPEHPQNLDCRLSHLESLVGDGLEDPAAGAAGAAAAVTLTMEDLEPAPPRQRLLPRRAYHASEDEADSGAPFVPDVPSAGRPVLLELTGQSRPFMPQPWLRQRS